MALVQAKDTDGSVTSDCPVSYFTLHSDSDCSELTGDVATNLTLDKTGDAEDWAVKASTAAEEIYSLTFYLKYVTVGE